MADGQQLRSAVAVLLCVGLLSARVAGAQCGDVDLSGAVGGGDVTAFRAFLADPVGSGLAPDGYAQCTVYGRSRPCDVLDASVLRRSLAGLGPGLGDGCVDGDADGVPDADDACPQSPPGVPFLLGEDGCTVLDLILRPESLVEPALAELDEAPRLLGGPVLRDTHARLRELHEAADAWRAELGDSAAALPDGYPGAYCDGRWDDAASGLSQARALVSESGEVIHGIAAGEDALAAPDPSEVPDAHSAVAALELGLASMDRAISEIGRTASALAEACAANAGPLAARVQVERIDDATRTAQVRDLGSGARYPVALKQGAGIGSITAGTQADLGGLGLGSNGAVANDMTPVDPGSPEDAQAACLFLRVAPPQWFGGTEPLLHTAFEPYERSAGDAVLERGARLAVVGSGCSSGGSPLGPFSRYSMKIEVAFPAGFPPLLQTHLVVAADLEPGDAPVQLPSLLPDGTAAELTATVRRQTCYLIGPPPLTLSCGPVEDHRIETHTLTVVPTGSLCTANFMVTRAKLEDDDVNGYVTDWANTPTVDTSVVEPGTSPEFRAQACQAAPNATSCANGQYVPVIGSSVFHVYNHDFFPLYGGTPLAESFAGWKHGVGVPAGVRWPRVRGTRQSGSFYYSCEVPRVVRDVVNFCTQPATQHSYYRMPYYPNGAMGKGNYDQDPGHTGSQSYAFDFGMFTGDAIRAARGGRVVLAHEDSTGSDQPCWDQFGPYYGYCYGVETGMGATPEQAKATCMASWIGFFGRECDLGNYLYLQHQDGTYGVYFHMVHNGIYVSPSQIAHRGWWVGTVGQTGASGNADHLHFEVDDGLDTANSIQVRFQTQTQTCMIPQDGDMSLSSNDPAAAY